MAALSWLLIPVAVAVLTGLWASWSTRKRPVIQDADGVAGYERFRAAMERSSRERAPALSGQASQTPSDPSARAAD